MVNAEAKKKATAEYKHREELINEAKLAYSASKKHDDGIFLLLFFSFSLEGKEFILSSYKWLSSANIGII